MQRGSKMWYRYLGIAGKYTSTYRVGPFISAAGGRLVDLT
jgi:hypothetical protein